MFLAGQIRVRENRVLTCPRIEPIRQSGLDGQVVHPSRLTNRRIATFAPPGRLSHFACADPRYTVDSSLLDNAQDLIGYRFSDLSLLQRALTHASVANHRLESNERLEFLGDAVLGLAVVHRLYDQQPDLLEGEMTKIKSSVVSRATCAKIADAIGLCEVMRLGKGMNGQGQTPRSVAAAALEAIIGAIFVDGGIGPASEFIHHHVDPYIDEALENEHQDNFKSMLQQHAQQVFNAAPDYHLLDEQGPDHSKCFEVAVVIDGHYYPSAWGINKKEAEQKAAQKALVDLGIIDPPDNPGDA